MNAKLFMLAIAVAVIGAGALMMCDDSDAAAGDVLASGSCGATLTYEVRSINADDSQVKLTISGSGAMTEWTTVSSVPWSAYVASLVEVSLPSGLTNISYISFYDCAALTTINVPDSVTSIGGSAFARCAALTSIELPDGLIELGSAAFSQSGITSLYMPDGITEIRFDTFKGCAALASIHLPAALEKIGQTAFNGCSSLASLVIPETLTSFGSGVFTNCNNLKNVTMPIVNYTSNISLSHVENLTYNTAGSWTSGNATNSVQYESRSTLRTITFFDDHIPSYALRNLTASIVVTNASGPDYLGIYTSPNTKATIAELITSGSAADIVRLTDVRGAAELLDGGINLNDVDVHWDTSPHGYATGEVDTSPEVLVYPAGIHTSAPNQYAGLINAIPLIVIVAIITTIIGMMAVRRD